MLAATRALARGAICLRAAPNFTYSTPPRQCRIGFLLALRWRAGATNLPSAQRLIGRATPRAASWGSWVAEIPTYLRL